MCLIKHLPILVAFSEETHLPSVKSMEYGPFLIMVSSVYLRILFDPLGLVSRLYAVSSDGEGMISLFLILWNKEKVREGDSNLPCKLKSPVI